MKTITLTADGTLTPAEVERCQTYMEETGRAVLDVTNGLSPAQWNFQETPERWSIAGIVEHMVVIQEIVLGPVRAGLAGAPAGTEERNYKEVEDVIYQKFPVRAMQIQAPDPARPTGRWTPETTLERMKTNFAALKEYVATTPDIRLRTIEAAPLKTITGGALDRMDGYQWVLACAAHTKRHTGQIEQVKADPKYPA